MRNGYKLFWSERALLELQNIINYLTKNWTTKEVQNFARKLDKRLRIIIDNPKLFPITIDKYTFDHFTKCNIPGEKEC